jgi:periplasmic protein TonB
MRSTLFSKTIAVLFFVFGVFILITSFSPKQDSYSISFSVNPPKHYGMDTLPGTGSNTIADTVEVEASVDVGAWRRHLEKELMPVINKAAKKRMKPGQYIVMIRFLVEKDGSISDVKALNDPGYGLAQGAEKVLKKGPKWTPGKINGRSVRSYHSQAITFVISP